MSRDVYGEILRFILCFLTFMVFVRKFPTQYCPLLADEKPNLMIFTVKGKLESSEIESLSLQLIKIDWQVLC